MEEENGSPPSPIACLSFEADEASERFFAGSVRIPWHAIVAFVGDGARSSILRLYQMAHMHNGRRFRFRDTCNILPTLAEKGLLSFKEDEAEFRWVRVNEPRG
jgi:hypothetical protein